MSLDNPVDTGRLYPYSDEGVWKQRCRHENEIDGPPGRAGRYSLVEKEPSRLLPTAKAHARVLCGLGESAGSGGAARPELRSNRKGARRVVSASGPTERPNSALVFRRTIGLPLPCVCSTATCARQRHDCRASATSRFVPTTASTSPARRRPVTGIGQYVCPQGRIAQSSSTRRAHGASRRRRRDKARR